MDVVGDRVERLLALLLLQGMKGQAQREKAVLLSLAGFSSVEIADLLQTSSNVIRKYIYMSRQRKRSKK